MYKKALVMGMPASIRVVDPAVTGEDIASVFHYWESVDQRFSPFRRDSEVERINRGEVSQAEYSRDTRAILAMCEETKLETNGYFDAYFAGKLDPSGLVKGLAVYAGAEMLRQRGFRDLYVEIGGDIQTFGRSESGEKWRVGIQSPFDLSKLVKVVSLSDHGIATSGTYMRGNHIEDPVHHRPATEVASVTVIGPNIYEADRFATAAFAMGRKGLELIASLDGFEGCMITHEGRLLSTEGFERYVAR